MLSINVELNNKPRKDGLYTILLRLTLHRKHKRVSLNRYVLLRHFNNMGKFGNWIRTSCPDHKEINELLKTKILALQQRESELISSGVDPSLSRLLDAKPRQIIKNFIEFARNEITRHRSQGQLRTAVKKQHLISKVVEFYGREDIQFNEVTVTFLKDYESFWTTRGNKINTIQTDFKGIRAIIRSAIQEGFLDIDQNPFNRYKIKSEKTYRDKLEEHEIQALANLILPEGSLEWHSRNMFLFAYYCAGIRFGDLLQVTWQNVQDGHLSYIMDKTGDPHMILLTQESKRILDLYRTENQKTDDYIFPFFKRNKDYSDSEYLTKQISSKNALVNKYLKKIVKVAGINKKVSFHISRHSFAYMALRKTADVYSVSKSLNHKRLNTTEHYLKGFDVNASDNLLQKVFATG